MLGTWQEKDQQQYDYLSQANVKRKKSAGEIYITVKQFKEKGSNFVYKHLFEWKFSSP